MPLEPSEQSRAPAKHRALVHLQWLPPHLRPRPVIADRLRGDDGEPAELTPADEAASGRPEPAYSLLSDRDRLIARGCRPWPFNGRRLLALDGTANAEILGQFVPSLATRSEIQVQRNARVIQLPRRDLLPGLGRAAIGGRRAVSAIPEPVGQGRRTLAGEGAPRRP